MIKKEPVLICDGCGRQKRFEQPIAVSEARIDAAREGWRFMNYAGLRINGRNRAQQWDACFECELPDADVVIERLRTQELDRAFAS